MSRKHLVIYDECDRYIKGGFDSEEEARSWLISHPIWDAYDGQGERVAEGFATQVEADAHGKSNKRSLSRFSVHEDYGDFNESPEGPAKYPNTEQARKKMAGQIIRNMTLKEVEALLIEQMNDRFERDDEMFQEYWTHVMEGE